MKLAEKQNSSSSETSIIKIIQDMVREGETEEKIVQTLKELGVEPDKAKRLLLLGQADTFALLQGEISKIVQDSLEKEKPKLQTFLQAESDKAGKALKKTVADEVMVDIKTYEKQITGQSKTFQEQIAETIKHVTELADHVKQNNDQFSSRVMKVEQDLDEMKLRGVGLRNKLIAAGLLLIGIIFVLAALYLFVVNFNAVLAIDSLIVTVVMALIGITLIFVATLI